VINTLGPGTSVVVARAEKNNLLASRFPIPRLMPCMAEKVGLSVATRNGMSMEFVPWDGTMNIKFVL